MGSLTGSLKNWCLLKETKDYHYLREEECQNKNSRIWLLNSRLGKAGIFKQIPSVAVESVIIILCESVITIVCVFSEHSAESEYTDACI